MNRWIIFHKNLFPISKREKKEIEIGLDIFLTAFQKSRFTSRPPPPKHFGDNAWIGSGPFFDWELVDFLFPYLTSLLVRLSRFQLLRAVSLESCAWYVSMDVAGGIVAAITSNENDIVIRWVDRCVCTWFVHVASNINRDRWNFVRPRWSYFWPRAKGGAKFDSSVD